MGKTVVLCDGSNINSHGFRIDLKGMDLSRFETNPVMLYRHDTEDVIGRWKNVRIENDKLLAEPDFDMDDELAAKIAGKVEREFLKGCSVGIYILEIEETSKKCVATRTELLEASICAIPSDAGAVILYSKDHKKLSLEQAKLHIQPQTNMEDKTKIEQLEASVASKDAELKALKEKVAELESVAKEAQEKAIGDFLSAAVSEGKITEEEKPAYAKLAATDFDSVKSIVGARQPQTQQRHASLSSMLVTTGGKFDGKTWDELDKSGQLEAVKAENPELYKTLFDQKFKR